MSVDLQELLKWDDGLFRFHRNPEQLRKCLFLLAEKLGIVEYLSVSESQWDAFFKRIQDLMHPNPYHNFTHVCDVTQVSQYVSLILENLKTSACALALQLEGRQIVLIFESACLYCCL